MKTSCIAHPEDQPLIQIKAWQVYACDGNHCAAALLSFFEYWHNIKINYLENLSRYKKDVIKEPYQYQTDEDLRAGLLGLYTTKTIRESLRLIEEKGFVTQSKNPDPKHKYDNKKFFLFHPEKVNYYIKNIYPQRNGDYSVEGFMVDYVYTEAEKKSKLAAGKITNTTGKNAGCSGKNADTTGKNAGTITEITSEITTEITSNTWSEASSDEIKENISVDSGNPEKVETLILTKKKTKTLTKRELVQAAVSDPKSIAFFENLRNRFQLYSGNSYLRSFAAHKIQFYKTLAYRVANEEVTHEAVEGAFHEMTLNKDFSIMEFLEKLKNAKYNDIKVLIDFIWIMLDGKIAAFVAEKKGAKELSEWVEDGKVTLTEIEDCFLWLPSSGRGYKQSLISLKAALSAFDTVKTLNANGRFSGKSLNSEYKTSSEKSVEILKQRDYNQMASEILEESEAKKLRMAELIAIANGKK